MSEEEKKQGEEVSCDDLQDDKQVEKVSEKGELCFGGSEEDDVFEGAEPWDPIETKIVVGSFIAAIIFLAIFGYLINVFIL